MHTIEDLEIFLPTLNRPKFLKEALESLVGQSAGIPKITVFNNGTMEEVSQVVRSFGRYGVTEVRSSGGLLECMARAGDFLTKKYVMFFHDDDILNSRYLEYALKALNTYEDVAFVTAKYTAFRQGEAADPAPAGEGNYFFEKGEAFAQYMYLHEEVAMQTAIYDAGLFLRVPRESGRYGKFFDWPYLVRLSRMGNTVLFSDRRMFHVRIHGGQWTWDEKSSWTVEAMINWHKQFFEAMGARRYCSPGYFMFCAKFPSLFRSGYANLICDALKKECSLGVALEKAREAIGFDEDDMLAQGPESIRLLQDFSRRRFYCRTFGDVPCDCAVGVVDYLTYRALSGRSGEGRRRAAEEAPVSLAELLRCDIMRRISFGKRRRHYEEKYRRQVCRLTGGRE